MLRGYDQAVSIGDGVQVGKDDGWTLRARNLCCDLPTEGTGAGAWLTDLSTLPDERRAARAGRGVSEAGVRAPPLPLS